MAERVPEYSEKVFRWLSLAVIIVALCTILLHIFGYAAAGAVWDDAYMSIRYAHNVLAQGAIAWNGAVPTYGLTALALLIFSIPLVAIGMTPTAVAVLTSVLGALLVLVSIPFLLYSVIPSSESQIRRSVLALAYAMIALNADLFAQLAASGMDTLLSIAYLAFYIGLAIRFSRTRAPSRTAIGGLGALGAFAYIFRPDLMIFSALVPLAIAVLSSNTTVRAAAWKVIGCSVVICTAILAVLFLYFDTPLPLPFYAKSGFLYGPTIGRILKFQPILELAGYVDSYKYLFLALIAFVTWRWRTFFQRSENAVFVGIIAAAFISLVYFLFFVLQVMGYAGRFYYPTLPALVVVFAIVIRELYLRFDGERARSQVAIVISLIALGALYSPFAWGLQQSAYTLVHKGASTKAAWQSGVVAFYRSSSANETIWPCLDAYAALPNDASIATTEVGLPSVMGLDKKIIDLGGLNDTATILDHTPLFDRVLTEQVDFVYLPSQLDYPEMRSMLVGSAEFSHAYQIYSAQSLNAAEDVAVRKDSPYAPALRTCLDGIVALHANDSKAAPTWNTGYQLSLPYPLM